MKKLALFSLVWFLSSCSSVHKLDRIDYLSTIDFRSYTKNNFMFTPEKYNGEYESIGMVNYIATGSLEYRNLSDEEIKKSYETYFLGESITVFKNGDKLFACIKDEDKKKKQVVTEVRYLQNAIDSLYTKAKNMGADAVINFKATEELEFVAHFIEPTYRTKYNLSGFAIKRK